ncbi:hypothetical protein FM131_02470 [Weissella confusa]|nr:hypothetical protein FM131_02470 [Weissella confusa]
MLNRFEYGWNYLVDGVKQLLFVISVTTNAQTKKTTPS